MKGCEYKWPNLPSKQKHTSAPYGNDLPDVLDCHAQHDDKCFTESNNDVPGQ
jgi:hypothetical protein